MRVVDGEDALHAGGVVHFPAAAFRDWENANGAVVGAGDEFSPRRGVGHVHAAKTGAEGGTFSDGAAPNTRRGRCDVHGADVVFVHHHGGVQFAQVKRVAVVVFVGDREVLGSGLNTADE